MGDSLSRTPVVAGTGAVVLGAVAAATGSWSSQLDLRTGVVPWALGALVVGVGLILFGSYRGGIGRPRRLVRWGSNLALVGLGVAAAFFFGTGILAAVGSDLLSEGETLVSTLGTLIASVSTLLILPLGLLAFGVAVLIDEQLPVGVRVLPLVGTLAFMSGPVLIGVLPESGERAVFVVWPVLLGAVWAAYGLLATTELDRELERPSGAG